MSKKWLLTTVFLLTTPTFVFASLPAVVSGVAKAAAAKQNVPEPRAVSTDVQVAAAAVPASKPDRATSSFYAGLGISVLNDKGFTGLMPKAYLGYGTYIGKCKIFYGALEVFGGAGSIPLSPNQKYRVTSLIGASVIPGYMINDWALFFLRFGAEAVRYSNLDTTKSSGLVGVGLEIYTTPHWDARIEYDYAGNKNLNQFNFDFIYKLK